MVKKYNKKTCYGSIPNCFKFLFGMRKGSDNSFGINLGYIFYLHDRQYRNESKIRYTRIKSDNLLGRRIYTKFKIAGKYLLGYYVAFSFWIVLRPFGYFSWKK